MMSGNILRHIAERVTSMGKVIIKYENDDIKYVSHINRMIILMAAFGKIIESMEKVLMKNTN